MIMFVAYFVITMPAGLVLGNLVEKDYRNFRAVAVVAAATYIAGFAYFLIGRPKMPLGRVFIEHIAVIAVTWLIATPIARAIWGRASKSV
ncbi:hypothetical protein MGLY_27720 [Neomoorella glycerini]|uniref:Uncharacterized protein n=2 Tax=Neomoorella glycerini TaxID=55779 RepID=A0A6I5ZTW3_9FIRM|nr:hypothetical protein MGLY_27720 [Moorella glycerini]